MHPFPSYDSDPTLRKPTVSLPLSLSGLDFTVGGRCIMQKDSKMSYRTHTYTLLSTKNNYTHINTHPRCLIFFCSSKFSKSRGTKRTRFHFDVNNAFFFASLRQPKKRLGCSQFDQDKPSSVDCEWNRWLQGVEHQFMVRTTIDDS